jgi:hypothetical protein
MSEKKESEGAARGSAWCYHGIPAGLCGVCAGRVTWPPVRNGEHGYTEWCHCAACGRGALLRAVAWGAFTVAIVVVFVLLVRGGWR